MADMNAYFEYQRKLFTQSRFSNELKDQRSKKECFKGDVCKTRDLSRKCKKNIDVNEDADDASGSEYCPSDASASDDSIPSTSIITPRAISKLSKQHDDGNTDRFQARIKEWKLNKKIKCKEREQFSNEDGEDLGSEEAGYHKLTGGLNVPNCIWKRLYRYQKTGVKWLWELHQLKSGGLLGDEMGLGKTVQVISFLAALSVSKLGSWAGLGPSLVVAPATVLHQWVSHFHHWWPPLRVAVLHHSGSFQGAPEKLIRDMHSCHGVLVTTYSGMVKYRSSIEDKKWHYIVLDEGHKIRNAETLVSKAVRRIRTPHRMVVTGSPMQNNLQELWSLFDFMSPGLLGSLPAFVEHFAGPITQGGYTNASREQETAALSLATALKDTISPYMLRRTKAQVKDHLKLPDKKEQVLFCSLSDEQKDLYKSYLLSNHVRGILDKECRFGDPIRARILVALSVLRKICNHPDLYICQVDEDLEEGCLLTNLENNSFGFWKRAGKMIVINSLLKIWKKQGHRVLIFTQSRAMICILELFLQKNDYKYLKMDGTTGIGVRQPLISKFNSDASYLVFLATTRVGGLGVNLTGADRVIIYDPDWNPAIDSQAKERAWRIGQDRDVTIYRLLSAGTVEEKIYQRQVFKQLLGNKVFLDPKQKNYLKTSTLQGLFSLEEPDQAGSTETTNIFKHTQIKSNRVEARGLLFSKSKMDAMRRLAQQISQSMTSDLQEAITAEKEDPRERYRKSRLPPQPPPEVLPVNMHNDLETKANFSAVLSEIDIVTMCSKPEPLDFLKCIPTQEETTTDARVGQQSSPHLKLRMSRIKEENQVSPIQLKSTILDTFKQDNKKDIKVKVNKKRKRKKKGLEILLNESGLDEDEELRKSITKVKRKKEKAELLVEEDPDQYVLEKLFSKGVKSALQHDKVVGLAEQEQLRGLQQLSQRRAVLALKALRKSRLRSWRY